MDSILTVVTPASSYDLTTLEALKEQLKIIGNGEDPAFRRAITLASRIIADELNRVLAAESVSEQFRIHQGTWPHGGSHHGIPKLVLARYPVSTSGLAVVENGVTLTAADYELDPDSGRLARLLSDSPIRWCHGKIVVSYTGGYDLPDDAPAQLEKAVIKLINHYRQSDTRDPFVKSETVDIPGVEVRTSDFWVGSLAGGGNTSALPPEILDLIESFRNINMT